MIGMARMHTKRHGRSKSRKPVLAPDAKVTELTREQIEGLIENYAKQSVGAARIGEILKREHGVPYIRHAAGRRLMKILEEKGLAGPVPADMFDLMKKAVNLRRHIAANAHDINNTVRLRRIESKIWRLTKYYIRTRKLPQGWRYDPARAALLIKGG